MQVHTMVALDQLTRNEKKSADADKKCHTSWLS